MFVVKEHRASDILCQLSDLTWQAYNKWPSLAFFSGNSIHGEIQFYDNFEGTPPGRVFARTQKDNFEDEEKLMGVTSYGPGYGDWRVKNADHWVYEGTGLETGDKIPSIIGWEYHGPPYPKFDGLKIVAESPLSPAGSDKLHGAVVYLCSQKDWVFNAGTIWWPEGLSQPPGHIPAGHNPRGRTFGVNPHMQKITANVLEKMIKDSPR